ncbi:metal-dependent hydrolase [Mucilaginibacter sp. BT774]|uniref:metal-dependent hydrolase n=1 Tax=Mucilaginibacter sp. BT774 TaxID=3062276 RepID=UPI0026772A05|nr:metal-dependent hydrolase [Mucilaginibacter sp. BT774]MDO3628226.1 metal-dependent hydrolase [Mucilaginibacter sp. BT774]
MDIVTHLALGICTAEIIRKREDGKGILYLGGIVQCLPDIDTIAGLFLPADHSLLIHRGLTHSVFFATFGGFILSLIIYPIFKKKGKRFFPIFLFVLCQLTLHDLLDLCNAYGTGLLEPFGHQRFSVNLLFVADPLFSIGLIVAAILLLISSASYSFRARWVQAALLFSCCYLVYAGINKVIIDRRVNRILQLHQMNTKNYFTTPTPLNSMLWYIVIKSDSCYYTGYSSVFDSGSRVIELETQPKNYSLLSFVQGKHSVHNLRDFANGYYTFSGSDKALYINILRFGQIQGWREKNAPFVLSYPLITNQFHITSLQKNRLAVWDMEAVKNYIKRIGGN